MPASPEPVLSPSASRMKADASAAETGGLRRLWFVFLYYVAVAVWALALVVLKLLLLVLGGLPAAEKYSYLLRGLIRGFLRVFFGFTRLVGAWKIDVVGRENLPGTGGAILVANHPSIADAPVMMYAFPHLRCFYKAKLENTLLTKRTASLLGFIPNDRGIDDLKVAMAMLRDGHRVLLFPEGTRTEQIPLNPFLSGHIFAARETKAPIVPIFIETTSELLSKQHRSIWLPPSLPVQVTLRIQEPWRLDPTRPAREEHERLEEAFHRHMSSLGRQPYHAPEV